jgi:hypothetical protein
VAAKEYLTIPNNSYGSNLKIGGYGCIRNEGALRLAMATLNDQLVDFGENASQGSIY